MLPKTQQATNTEVEGETTVIATGTDGAGQELTTETQQQSEQSTPTEETQTETSTEDAAGVESKNNQPEKNRHAKRTEKLIDTLKAKTDENSALRKQLDSMRKNPVQQETQLPPWLNNNQPQVPQGEVTLEQYQAQVAGAARDFARAEITAYQDKVSRYEDFKNDLTKVESKYPILNADSEQYDAEKAAQVTDLYQKASAGDPSLRLADFVDSIMSFHKAGESSGKSELTTSVIRKDAEAAVTPNPTTGEQGSTSDEWDSMTLPEKERWMKANGFWD